MSLPGQQRACVLAVTGCQLAELDAVRRNHALQPLGYLSSDAGQVGMPAAAHQCTLTVSRECQAIKYQAQKLAGKRLDASLQAGWCATIA